MKRIILGLLLVLAVSIKVSAQTDTTSASKTMSNTASNNPTKYWYYPEQNVYQNETTNEYWYYSQPGTKWMNTGKLPDTYDMSTNPQRYEITYTGTDVWKENKAHKTKYKVKKDGTVKQKPDPSKQ